MNLKKMAALHQNKFGIWRHLQFKNGNAALPIFDVFKNFQNCI